MMKTVRLEIDSKTDAHRLAEDASADGGDLTDEEAAGVSGGWLPKFMQPPSNYDRALAKFRPK